MLEIVLWDIGGCLDDDSEIVLGMIGMQMLVEIYLDSDMLEKQMGW